MSYQYLQKKVDEADRAAYGDSNDAEILSLRDALDVALDALGGFGVRINRTDWHDELTPPEEKLA